MGQGLAKSQLISIFVKKTRYKTICNIFRPNTGLLSSFQSMQRYCCRYLRILTASLDKWWSYTVYSFAFAPSQSQSEVDIGVKLKDSVPWKRFEIVTSYHLHRGPLETEHSSVAVRPDAHAQATDPWQSAGIDLRGGRGHTHTKKRKTGEGREGEKEWGDQGAISL